MPKVQDRLFSLFSFPLHVVVLSLSAPESVCEGGGVVQICVTLETDIERDVEATIETADAFAIGKSYWYNAIKALRY